MSDSVPGHEQLAGRPGWLGRATLGRGRATLGRGRATLGRLARLAYPAAGRPSPGRRPT